MLQINVNRNYYFMSAYGGFKAHLLSPDFPVTVSIAEVVEFLNEELNIHATEDMIPLGPQRITFSLRPEEEGLRLYFMINDYEYLICGDSKGAPKELIMNKAGVESIVELDDCNFERMLSHEVPLIPTALLKQLILV